MSLHGFTVPGDKKQGLNVQRNGDDFSFVVFTENEDGVVGAIEMVLNESQLAGVTTWLMSVVAQESSPEIMRKAVEWLTDMRENGYLFTEDMDEKLEKVRSDVRGGAGR